MTRAYSLAFKQKMVERLTGKNALNQSQLAGETGVRQQNLCRWLEEARSLPLVASNNPKARVWTVEQKAQALAGALKRPMSRTHVTRSSTVHRASAPNKVWSWDITWLPTNVRGIYQYLYLVMDVWSRRIVGWKVAERESAEFAAARLNRATSILTLTAGMLCNLCARKHTLIFLVITIRGVW